MNLIRSILFNILYYGLTLIIGIIIIPALFLPEKLYWPVIRAYFYFVYLLERTILGLNYRVIGRENLPNGPYLVAAKHQSAYETLKLPLLFSRPAVIVKKSLLQIPFWGWYAAKAGMIGIDRSKPRAAMGLMIDGVKNALAQGRTVVIFPQGTRVAVGTIAPYKRGIAELYEATNLPVVPMALNTGLFWPRNAFLKRGGMTTLQFLPAIPAGLPTGEFMTRLEQILETTSTQLVQNP
jgi:1-acyl-sn-glycerol-3-phosphate acyltransferase